MSTRDSGVIDLFAIHKEEERRVTDAAPSAAPPAMAMDIDTSNVDPELFAASQQKRTRTKILGGIVGGVAVLGILVAAITTSGTKPPVATAAAAAPPTVATVIAAPPPADPTPMPAPPTTASGKPEYTPATAAAAYAAAQPKKKGAGKGAKIGTNVKMQKVQSGGVN